MNGFGRSRSEVQGIPVPSVPFKLLDGESRKPISASKVDCHQLNVSEMHYNTVQSFFQLVPINASCPQPYYHIVNVGSNRALMRGVLGDEVLLMPLSFMNSSDMWEVIPSNTFSAGYYLLQEVQSHRYLARGRASSVITVPQEHEIGLRHMWMFSFMEGVFRGIPPTQTSFMLGNLGSGRFLCIEDTAVRRSITTCEMHVVGRMDLQFRLVAPVPRGLFQSAYLIESVMHRNQYLSIGLQGRQGEYLVVKPATLHEENSIRFWTILPCNTSLGAYVLRHCATNDVFLSALAGSNSVTLCQGNSDMTNLSPFQQWIFVVV